MKILQADKKLGIWKYEVSLQLVEGELVTLSPAASMSIFTPQSVQLKGALGCINITKPMFSAEKGQVISGNITSQTSIYLIICKLTIYIFIVFSQFKNNNSFNLKM